MRLQPVALALLAASLFPPGVHAANFVEAGVSDVRLSYVTNKDPPGALPGLPIRFSVSLPQQTETGYTTGSTDFGGIIGWRSGGVTSPESGLARTYPAPYSTSIASHSVGIYPNLQDYIDFHTYRESLYVVVPRDAGVLVTGVEYVNFNLDGSCTAAALECSTLEGRSGSLSVSFDPDSLAAAPSISRPFEFILWGNSGPSSGDREVPIEFSFTTNSVYVYSASSVPEPAQWMLMSGSLLFLAVLVRRRRRASCLLAR